MCLLTEEEQTTMISNLANCIVGRHDQGDLNKGNMSVINGGNMMNGLLVVAS